MSASLDRRRALRGAAAVTLGLPVMAACGSDSSGNGADTATGTRSPSSSRTGGTGSGGSAGAALASTADIPVGGCAVFEGESVVVTQPTEGDFKAFSATCTHQGCSVSSSSDGHIPCNCHGSRFSLADGSVINGPATSPLGEVAITVKGDSIILV